MCLGIVDLETVVSSDNVLRIENCLDCMDCLDIQKSNKSVKHTVDSSIESVTLAE